MPDNWLKLVTITMDVFYYLFLTLRCQWSLSGNAIGEHLFCFLTKQCRLMEAQLAMTEQLF